MESIIRAATREDGVPLNIILFNSDERYAASLAKTGHNFYLLGNRWNHKTRLLPENFTEIANLNYGIGYDLVLCLGRYRGFNECRAISNSCHVPLVLAELDSPNPNVEFKTQSGDINIFIDNKQANAWGLKTGYHLINNCFDSDLFTLDNTPKEDIVLTNITLWRERDWSHGFRLYHRNIGDAPKKLLVDPHWQEVSDEYKKALIYVNPTTHVYQPIELLEAMACGCIPISFRNTPTSKLFKTQTCCEPNELNEKIKQIISLPKEELQELSMYSFEEVCFEHVECVFVSEWNKLLKDAAGIPFTGK